MGDHAHQGRPPAVLLAGRGGLSRHLQARLLPEDGPLVSGLPVQPALPGLAGKLALLLPRGKRHVRFPFFYGTAPATIATPRKVIVAIPGKVSCLVPCCHRDTVKVEPSQLAAATLDNIPSPSYRKSCCLPS